MINRYDILKCVAVVSMIVSHCGSYLVDWGQYETNWLYAIGRVGLPVWFFFAGIHHASRISPPLVVCALLLQIATAIMGASILPLNALFSLIIGQLVAHSFYTSLQSKNAPLWGFYVFVPVLVALHPVLRYLWDYGSLALLLAMCGSYYHRTLFILPNERRTVGLGYFRIDYKYTLPLVFFTALALIIYQLLPMTYSPFQIFFIIASWAIVSLCFSQRLYDSVKIPLQISQPLKWVSRNTLGIYFVHMIIFTWVSLCLLR